MGGVAFTCGTLDLRIVATMPPNVVTEFAHGFSLAASLGLYWVKAARHARVAQGRRFARTQLCHHLCHMAKSTRLSLGNFVASLTWAAVRASVFLIGWVKTVGSLALSAPSVPRQLTRDSLAFLEEACRRADVGRPFIAYFIRHLIGREGKACRQLGAWTESRLGARRLIHFHGRPDTNREVRGYAASGIWGHLPPSALLHQAQASNFSSQAKPHPTSKCKQLVRRFSEQTCPCPVQTCLHCRPRFLPCQARFRQ